MDRSRVWDAAWETQSDGDKERRGRGGEGGRIRRRSGSRSGIFPPRLTTPCSDPSLLPRCEPRDKLRCWEGAGGGGSPGPTPRPAPLPAPSPHSPALRSPALPRLPAPGRPHRRGPGPGPGLGPGSGAGSGVRVRVRVWGRGPGAGAALSPRSDGPGGGPASAERGGRLSRVRPGPGRLLPPPRSRAGAGGDRGARHRPATGGSRAGTGTPERGRDPSAGQGPFELGSPQLEGSGEGGVGQVGDRVPLGKGPSSPLLCSGNARLAPRWAATHQSSAPPSAAPPPPRAVAVISDWLDVTSELRTAAHVCDESCLLAH